MQALIHGCKYSKNTTIESSGLSYDLSATYPDKDLWEFDPFQREQRRN